MAASVLKPITDEIGKVAGQAVGGLVGQVGGGVEGLIGQAMKAFNPLGSLLGGFQSPGLTPSMPFPFSPGGMSPGVFNNPLGNIFGGGGFPGVGGGGFPGVGGPPGGGSPSTGVNESFGQLQNDMQAAVKSGDPMQMFQAQQKMNQYQEMVGMLSAIQKSEHDLITSITQKIA